MLTEPEPEPLRFASCTDVSEWYNNHHRQEQSVDNIDKNAEEKAHFPPHSRSRHRPPRLLRWWVSPHPAADGGNGGSDDSRRYPSGVEAAICTAVLEEQRPGTSGPPRYRVVVGAAPGGGGGGGIGSYGETTAVMGSKTLQQADRTCWHASFELPEAPLDVCWCPFAFRPHAPLLCVLSGSAATLHLWDVYPASSSSEQSSATCTSSSWTVALPFDCSRIHPLGQDRGLLLCRQDDEADAEATLPTGAGLSDDPEDAAMDGPAFPLVPSLFTLAHPLEDVLPVLVEPFAPHLPHSVHEPDPSPLGDAREQVLWVGTCPSSSSSHSGNDHNNDADDVASTILCVTYHTALRRHAVWTLRQAPPPPAAPPLYEQTRHRTGLDVSSTSTGAAANPTSLDWWMVEGGLTRPSLLHPPPLLPTTDAPIPVTGGAGGGGAAASAAPAHAREEALADALGVVRRLTPRAASTAAAAPPLPTVPGSQRHPSHAAHPATALAETFHSPRAAELETASSFFGDSSWTHLGTAPMSGDGTLHAAWAAHCLYRDQDATVAAATDAAPQEPANRAFFASSSASSSSQWLCLVGDGRLRFFRVTTSASAGPSVVPCPEATVPCHDAQAVGEFILVASTDPAGPALVLFRGPEPIVACQAPPTAALPPPPEGAAPWCLHDAVHRFVTLYHGQGPDRRWWRVRVSAEPSSAAAQRALRVIEAALPTRPTLAAKLRTDVCRVEQRLSADFGLPATAVGAYANSSLPPPPKSHDIGFAGLEAVITTVVERALLGPPSASPSPDPRDTPRSAWEILLASEYHYNYECAQGRCPSAPYEGDPAAFHTLRTIQSVALRHYNQHPEPEVVLALFDSLHLLYEEGKLCRRASVTQELPPLSRLLLRLVALASRDPSSVRFQDYYAADRPYVMEPSTASMTLSSSSQPARMTRSSIRMQQVTSFPDPPSALRWLERRIRGDESGQDSVFDGAQKVLECCPKLAALISIAKTLFASRKSNDNVNDLRVIRLLLQHGFTEPRRVQEFPPGVALPLLELLHRCRTNPTVAELPGWTPEAWKLVGRHDLSQTVSMASAPSLAFGFDLMDLGPDPDQDGLVPLEMRTAMLFPHDNRIHEATRLLRSSQPIFLRVSRPVEVSDHDYERLKQKRLAVLACRAFALPVGRGMLTIGGLRPLAAERLPIPDLCLKGRIPPTNASLVLDEAESPADLRVWPEFHNGVASGLRLPARGESDVPVTRTWIVYNRPPPGSNPAPSPTDDDSHPANPAQQRLGHTHAGLLLALGLRGHLAALDMSDVYEYLTQGSVTTTVGVLLGMSANKRGSCDMAVSKMLCLHIPSLIPQHFSAIDVASTVQAAAVIGCGLLFQRSSHRMMTEFLLNEIGRRPESEASGLDRDSYTLSCGLALGMVNLCVGEKTGDRGAGIADLRVEERLHRYMVGGVDRDEAKRRRETNDRFSLPSHATPGDSDKCCTIYEGDLINTAVTAPGATLAIGLMYMKSGNRTIAASLSVPDTHFLLEFARPDFLTLRLISKALVLWDEVEPTDEWIDQQIPTVVHLAYSEMRDIAKRAMEGTNSSKSHPPEYDRRAVRQIRAHLLAGACFGMGLRFAGTSDPAAKSTLTKRVWELYELREGKDALAIASRPEEPILESCLSTATIALAMVMAGSGDLDTLRVFKVLRWRCDEGSRYGHHMMYGMAIGLLFLGGGTSTIGREPEDLAALVAAFFPRFPVATSDNEYHLQALRHLYALAVHRQDICALDVDTHEPVHLPVRLVRSKCPSPTELWTPCLVPNSDVRCDALCVQSPHYYPLTIALRGKRGRTVFYVKRRTDPRPEFPDGYQSGLGGGGQNSASPGPPVRSLERYLARRSDLVWHARCLRECVRTWTSDTDAADATAALSWWFGPSDRTAPGWHWDLRLARAYYCGPDGERRQGGSEDRNHRHHRLLDVDLLLACLHETAEQSVAAALEHHRGSALVGAESLYGGVV